MRSRTYPWQWRDRNALRRDKFETLPGGNIQGAHVKSKYQPFSILDERDGPNINKSRGPVITRYGGSSSTYSKYPWRNPWPVTQPPFLGRYAVAADRPAHTHIATQYSAPYEHTDQYDVKIMLCGLTDKSAGDLVPLARLWLRAPKLINTAIDHVTYRGYDPTERVYRFRWDEPPVDNLEFEIAASEAAPLVNLALVFEGWGKASDSITRDGRPGRLQWPTSATGRTGAPGPLDSG